MSIFFDGKLLRMAWELEKGGPTSYLVATAHFFPYRFERTFTRRMKRDVDTVLFEGPLDEKSMERVREYGQDGTGHPTLLEMLDAPTVRKVNRKLANINPVCSLLGSCFPLFNSSAPGFLETETKGFRPWMAFFAIWATYVRTRNWSRSTDMEAYEVAAKLGKKVHFLETIDEQLAALDGVPVEKICAFLADIDQWDSYTKRFVDFFMKGDLESMVSSTTGFPTRCPSIVGDRDPVLFERMQRFVERERVMILVGTIHIPGINERFIRAGWRVRQVTL